MEERTTVSKNHKLVVNNRKTSLVTGVLDVLSFDLNAYGQGERSACEPAESGKRRGGSVRDDRQHRLFGCTVGGQQRREYFCKIVPVTHATDSGRSRDFSCCTAYWDDRAVGLYRTECVPSNCQT